MSTHLLVTGMPRTGTTLVDKLLSLHPRAQVLSQPLPLLYVHVKRTFLESRAAPGARDPLALRYPLNDLLGPRHYPPAEFTEFLETLRLSRELCREALEEMVPFDGQYTKPRHPFRVLDGYRPASLHDFVHRYLRGLVSAGGLRVVGSKETSCEEFIPYLLRRGARVIAVLRDPRDVLTSLNHGRGRRFGGRRKPLLFNLRQWRKSVAFALAMAPAPGFLSLRYEDLVRDPSTVAARVTDFLGLDRFEPRVFDSDLRTQSGEIWHSNSSHRPATRIQADSVGRYRRHLSPDTDRVVQALCFAEMRALGYPLDVDADEVAPILDGYRDDQPLERPTLAPYVWSEQRRREETSRWRKLRDGELEPAWFLFEAAFSRLARAAGRPG